jgi:hypothetical protein
MCPQYPASDTTDPRHDAWLATSEACLELNAQHQAFGLGPDFRAAWLSIWGRVLTFPYDGH